MNTPTGPTPLPAKLPDAVREAIAHHVASFKWPDNTNDVEEALANLFDDLCTALAPLWARHAAEVVRLTSSLIAILSNTEAADAKQHLSVPEMMACMMVRQWRETESQLARESERLDWLDKRRTDGALLSNPPIPVYSWAVESRTTTDIRSAIDAAMPPEARP